MESTGIGSGHSNRGAAAPAAGTVLVVDDLDANVRLLERLLVRDRLSRWSTRHGRPSPCADHGHVDVFDALTSSRPYKPAAPIERAFEELMAEADRGLRDRDLILAFHRVTER